MTGSVTGIDYQLERDEYLAQIRAKYGIGTSYGATSAQDASIFNNVQKANAYGGNTCTDGSDDGKIGFWSAAGNAIEGVFKGAINGLKGMIGIEEKPDGSIGWNPLKLLGSVALVAASIACPAVGVVACTVGAVSGAVQVGKGIYTAATATSDAEAKQAWENIGEGASTVVGSVAGAKASMGAMKATVGLKIGSADDIINAADDILKSADDVLKNSDDAAKSVADMLKSNNAAEKAKAIKALKKAGLDNADDIIKNLDNVDDLAKTIGESGTTSHLSQVDDSLTGLDKLKAQGKALWKDAKTSTKNNLTKISTKVKTAKAEKAYNKALDNADEAAEAVNKASEPESITGSIKKQYENTSVEGLENELKNLYKNADKNADKIKYLEALKKQKLANDDVAKIAGKLDDVSKTKIKTNREAKKSLDAQEDFLNTKKDVTESTEKLNKMTEEGKGAGNKEYDELYKTTKEKADSLPEKKAKLEKEGLWDDTLNLQKQKADETAIDEAYKAWKKAGKDDKAGAQTTYDDLVKQYNEKYGKKYTGTNKVQQANAMLTKTIKESNIAEQYNKPLTGTEKTGILSRLRQNVLSTDMIKAIGKDGMEIVNFLQNKSLPDAINNFGYNNVMEVLKTAYGLGLANESI